MDVITCIGMFHGVKSRKEYENMKDSLLLCINISFSIAWAYVGILLLRKSQQLINFLHHHHFLYQTFLTPTRRIVGVKKVRYATIRQQYQEYVDL